MEYSLKTCQEKRKRQNLFLFWFSQFISQLGDQLFFLTGGFLVLSLSLEEGSKTPALQTGIMGVMQALPILIFSLFAGVIVDRFSRQKIMIVSDLMRALLLCLIPAFYFLGVLTWWWPPVIAFAAYSFSSLFNPARDSLIPELVEKKDLLKTNAFFQSSFQIAVILGSSLIGFANHLPFLPTLSEHGKGTHDARAAILFIGIVIIAFLASACLLIFLKLPKKNHSSQSDIKTSPPHFPSSDKSQTFKRLRPFMVQCWNDSLESIRFLLQDSKLRLLLLLTALNNFFIMGPATIGAQLLIKRDLGLSLSHYGIFELSMGIGWLLGTFWILRWGKNIRKRSLLLSGLIGDGLTYIPLFFLANHTPFEYYLLIMLLHGFFIPWITASRTAIIQSSYPSSFHGRLFAFVNITVIGFMALSAGATGFFGEFWDAHTLFLIAGIGGACTGILGFFSKSLRKS